MQTKSTVILLALVLLLGGYVLVFERSPREAVAFRELDARAIRFSPESLSSLRLKKEDLEIECVRTDGKWTLSYPVMARVSPEHLDRMITGLASLKRSGTVPVKGVDDLKRYGFIVPRVRLQIVDNQGDKTWLIGRNTPLGNTLYVMEEGAAEAVVTDARVLAMFPSSVEDVRDRSIFPRNMTSVNRIDIRRKAGFLQLGADAGGGWRIQQPTLSAAENAKVGKLLKAVLQTRIEKFVADEVTDMTSYGLQDPQAQIMLASDEEPGIGLLIGNPVPDDAGLVYAKQTEEYAIFAVSTNVLSLLQVDANQLRDRRLLTMDVNRVRHISVQQADNRQLVLSRDDVGVWELTEPRRWSADQEKVALLMAIWQTAKAEQFVVVDKEVEDPRGELAVTLTFKGADDADSCVLKLYRPKKDGDPALCAREGDDMLFAYNQNLLQIDEMRALDFKNRSILSVQSEKVAKITQQSGTNETVIVRNDAGEFTGASADRLKNFWAALKDLKVQAYVKENPESLAVYGLASPRFRVTLSLRDSDELGRVLLIGDACAGGTYAMLQGTDIVFIMNETDMQTLCGNLNSNS